MFLDLKKIKILTIHCPVQPALLLRAPTHTVLIYKETVMVLI